MTDTIRHNPPVKRYFVNGKGKLREIEVCLEGPVFSITPEGTNHHSTGSLTDTKAAAVALKLENLQKDLQRAVRLKEEANLKIDCIGILIDKVKALETDK